MYGLLERQFRRHFREANRRPGATGENLLRILEMRLDNAVYRLGFAESRAQARQLVQHGHFDVDGRKTDIPSFVCEVGNAISVRSRSRQLEYFKQMAEDLDGRELTGWLSRDVATLSGRIVSMPLRSDIDPTLEEQLIVEYYSR
jgi:small subunit ribosomal protein S4